MSKINNSNAPLLLLLFIMIVGSLFIFGSGQILNSKTALAEEEARPPQIEITILTTPECEDCFKTSVVVNAIETQSPEVMDIREVVYNSEEGKELISKYTIEKVPTVVISGEIEKSNIQPYLSKYATYVENVAVWTAITPIYISTETNEMVGRISMTLLDDTSCADCYDPAQHKSILAKNFGITISDEQTIDRNSSEGRDLVEKYAIKVLPTMILSSDVIAYQSLVSAWKSVGTIEEDGSFVFRNLDILTDAIYRNLETGEVVDTKKTQ